MGEPLDLSGKWTLSRALSDDSEEMLVLQNFNYFLRKAAKVGTITIVFRHDVKASPQTFEVTVIPPAGFAKESRTRQIDGERVEDKHFLFGTNYVIWNHRTKADELDDYFLEEEWVNDNLLEELIESGDGKFVNEGIWGMIEKDGKRQLVKRAIVKTTDGRRAVARQVFEYSPLD
ncbi:uncharacterized protein PV09_07091 [Verruconis gallopava]|uniref:Lipocalin-like domain-containing protein n=1 Tax=Verruconis gallopava TaxID=253628 RepID=A0A0D2A545_9PEZI|nr:uncharacterized protein PV09_07091 [Verruconis gallopava]KIW01620.1 hypothetical protein PV09_07091 [Verruconis gallopava]